MEKVRRFNQLKDELDELAATAVDWHWQMPAADKAAWTERKRQVLADLEATMRAEPRRVASEDARRPDILKAASEAS